MPQVPCTPALTTALLLAGPALVYFLPDDSTVLVALQFALALVCVLGGAAALRKRRCCWPRSR
ncbi:MAG: DUF1118 domain-containing protein [Burkholderiales bacterium]|nr:DUF1118 domain-containing protein [Burkholderiales bacterium]